MTIRPGSPYPLGSYWDGGGTNFSVYAPGASRVELCLFDADDDEQRIPMYRPVGFNWHCYVPQARPGQRYGFRADGQWDPANGLRFNADKLLLDPHAKAIEGGVAWDLASPLPYEPDGPDSDLVRDASDSADAVPKCVVIDQAFDWQGDRPPRIPWEETVIYEAHVRGLTKRHPAVREDLRGTYAGLASEPITNYLRQLGVTAIELLPVHQFVDEQHLVEKGLANYWGYASIGFFAPHAAYAATGTAGQQVNEFKGMVKALHYAGIEVVLDVVYNHTAEGNHLGPMLAFKGLDNRAYYRTEPDNRRYYRDFTGTGNTLDLRNQSVLRTVLDSLRYWVLEMHVDGFRFDLAPALGRGSDGFADPSPFLAAIHQDPVLSQVKLIAEPWDIGPDGYRLGAYPVHWSEWNGRYRDHMRDFWRGAGANVADFAAGVAGSAETFQSSGRGPRASINLVTTHDGFSLADLVAYEQKHNEANGEANNDGHGDNRSWNCGVEGPTDDPQIRALRARQQRNFLATMLLSQGVPMILGGDEISRTQQGNNNAYCQDNEISWLDWDLDDERRALLDFTRRVIALRRDHPVLRRRTYFRGKTDGSSSLRDIWWFRGDGREMARRDWRDPDLRSLGLFINGAEVRDANPDGSPCIDASFLMIVNAGGEPTSFRLPARRFGRSWSEVLATDRPDDPGDAIHHAAGDSLTVVEHSLTLLRKRA